ncbi:hypothetical protein CASFOL_016111 [Castilleja foliolosa]|uniref:Uncharacterized protein n=1 Tax=Castilleja foliolosa TaxID=1961234 RepID=A0ABD3DFN4_9LAMI
MAAEFNTKSFPFYPRVFLKITKRPLVTFAKKKIPQTKPVVNPSIIEEVSTVGDEEDDIFSGGLRRWYELVDDDGDFGDEYFAEEAEPFVTRGWSWRW